MTPALRASSMRWIPIAALSKKRAPGCLRFQPIPPALAAKWRAMSCPATAPAHASGRRRSHSDARGTEMLAGSAPRATSVRTTGSPRNPAPPVTRIFLPWKKLNLEFQADGECFGSEDPATVPRGRQAGLFHVGIHHDADELLEGDLRLPAEEPPRLGRVGDQVLDLRGAEVLL